MGQIRHVCWLCIHCHFRQQSPAQVSTFNHLGILDHGRPSYRWRCNCAHSVWLSAESVLVARLRCRDMIKHTARNFRIWLAMSAAGMMGIVGSFAACSWSWEEDNCEDVACPSGCTIVSLIGPYSSCNVQGVPPAEICCNCYYWRRVCYNSFGQECFRQSPPAPNPYAWDCYRVQANPPCVTTGIGKQCIDSEPPQDPP